MATQGPRILAHVSLDHVLRAWTRAYTRGRHGKPPDPAFAALIRRRGDAWVLASIPIDDLDFETEDEASEGRIRRARQYAAAPGPFPPGVATYNLWPAGSRWRTGRAFVFDGNHRTLAAAFRGETRVPMFIAAPEYEMFVHDRNARASSS